jgi:hypothetical protein
MRGTTEAFIRDANVMATPSVHVTGSDDSRIFAVSGEVAVASDSVAIGAALSQNLIDSNVQAYVDSGSVSAPTIEIRADNTPAIDAFSLSGSGADRFALGGSVSLNDISITVDAHLSSGATVTSIGSVLEAVSKPL